MKLPHVRHPDLLISGIVLTIICGLQALATWQTNPQISGSWFGIGFLTLTAGIFLGLVDKSQFWLVFTNPFITTATLLSTVGLFIFATLSKDLFFRGFWTIAEWPTFMIMSMSGVSIGAILLGIQDNQKKDKS